MSEVSALPPKPVFTPDSVIINFHNGHIGLSNTINDVFFCHDSFKSFSTIIDSVQSYVDCSKFGLEMFIAFRDEATFGKNPSLSRLRTIRWVADISRVQQ